MKLDTVVEVSTVPYEIAICYAKYTESEQRKQTKAAKVEQHIMVKATRVEKNTKNLNLSSSGAWSEAWYNIRPSNIAISWKIIAYIT